MKSNITVLSAATDNDVKIVNKYFSTGIVSIGSLCRKLPYLLLDLVGNTKKEYSVVVEYDEIEHNFITIISAGDKHKFEIENSVTRHGVDESNSISMLKKQFIKDKFIKSPCSYAKIGVNYNHKTYVYEKQKSSKRNLQIFSFKVSNTTSLFRKLLSYLLPSNNKIGNIKVMASLSE